MRKSDDTDIVGFGLAPRINAVGRLSEAKSAVELMTTDDQSVAETLARQLQTENEKRQELCERIFREADVMVQTRVNLDTDRAIAIWAEGWHHGVVGIVASRLVEKYHRPVFIGEVEVAEGVIRGSARGVDGMDLYEALKLNESLLNRWGGHKMAAGFSLESAKGDSFRAALVATCNRLLANSAANPSLNIDVSVEAEDVTQGLARHLTKLAPFGMGNKKPLLRVNDLRCIETRELGKEGKHHRITLQSRLSETTFEAVFWNSRNRLPGIEQDVHIVFTPEINSFNGRERLQLVLCDWQSANAVPTKIAPPAQPSYEALPDDKPVVAEVNASPDKESPRIQSASGLTFATRPLPSAAIEPESAPDALPETAPKAGSAAARSPITAGEALEAASDEQLVAAGEKTIDCSPPDSESGELETDNEIDSDDDARELAAEPPLKLSVPQAAGNAARMVVKDLRGYGDPNEALRRAASKLGSKVQIFAESKIDLQGVEFCDRTAVTNVEHLIFAQYPPSEKVVQAILLQANATTIYLVGRTELKQEDPAAFLRRLYGLVKYAVNQKDGQVEGEKLAALMSATKMSLALGLTLLRKVNLIDWFAEEGVLNLDLVGEPVGNAEELPEFKQLAASLKQATEYRLWCQDAELADIQEQFRALASGAAG